MDGTPESADEKVKSIANQESGWNESEEDALNADMVEGVARRPRCRHTTLWRMSLPVISDGVGEKEQRASDPKTSEDRETQCDDEVADDAGRFGFGFIHGARAMRPP